MVLDFKPLRYGHSEGHTDVCYALDGEKLITCGGDGDVRIWSSFEDDDPAQQCLGEYVLCARQKNDNIQVATDENSVRTLIYPSGERDGLLTRFTAPVNHISVGKDHNFSAFASEDMRVKVMNLYTKDTKIFTGFEGPVLGVTLCPLAKYLAASCGDGKLTIFKMEDQAVLKELHVVPKANSFFNAKVLCRTDFDPKHAKLFAYPHGHSIKLLQTSDWSESVSLEPPSVDINSTSSDLFTFHLTAFSPCTNYIAGATITGELVIWNLTTSSVMGWRKHPKGDIKITAIAWNPKSNGELIFADADGFVGLAMNCCEQLAMNCSMGDRNIEHVSNKKNLESAKDGPRDIIGMNDNDNDDKLYGTGYDDDNDGDIPVDRDDDDDIMDDHAIGLNRADEGSDDDDNENAVSLEKLKKDIMGDDDVDGSVSDKESMRRSPIVRSRTPTPPPQRTFQPGSTPEHLDPRYMCWNDVGIIRAYGHGSDLMNENRAGNEDAPKSIEVEFHDSTFHAGIMMPNYHAYTMGALSTGALVVANSNSINAIPLTSSSSKEWQLSLPDVDDNPLGIPQDDEICAICTSRRLVCFATRRRRLIHVFGVFGSRRGVFALPRGPLLAMAAHEDICIVAYHTAAPIKSHETGRETEIEDRQWDQCVECILVRFEGCTMQSKNIQLALTPGSKLLWLGFSDVGTPAMMDTSGMLYLYPLQSNIWMPFCDTRKDQTGLSDGFFPIAVYESLGTLRGIRCRGTHYPTFVPRPTCIELILKPTSADAQADGTERGKMEADLGAWSILQLNTLENNDSVEKKIKETALKVFALSAKNNADERALEFIELLGNQQVVNLAVKYASKLDKRRLAEKLMELLTKLDRDVQDDHNKSDRQETSTPNNTLKPNKKMMLMSASKILAKTKSQSSTSFNGTNTPPQLSTNKASSELDTTPTLSQTFSDMDSQHSTADKERKRNPFLKSLKKQEEDVYNPLSLTDSFAGVKPIEDFDTPESKRKQPDTNDTPIEKTKQRKLDRFMFSKRP